MSPSLASRSGRLALGAVVLSCAVAACGEPPIPVHPRTGEVLDAKYRPPSAPKEISGTIRLRGDLARAERGTVFVILRERGGRRPARLRSYVFGAGEISDARDGERTLAFKITDQDVISGMSGELPAQPELRVMYSPDGSVKPSGGQIGKELMVEYGAKGVEIVLP